ncbi:DEAD/DEAH box helicase [Treponema ruminis]|uniref:ATP-dependent RNA helicase DeaD n=1 Tax=Treponema ruminis TaxID=744515 RepID=A0A7W8LL02_9SPIR|nr:DEAD/DEAH box helicase [Treponema ruminis]MBB5224825.1 ATP-dependent RNA helicase DeaD [Treponema ruminis]
MENEELDGTAVMNGEAVSNAVSEEEPKSALDNYIDNLDRDFTDESDEPEEEDDGEISFADLGLDETVLAAIEKKGFKHPSPIQVLAIPRLLNGDSNIIAKARTGTGKTAAFGLPIVQRVHEESDHVRAVILEPTRELAIQTCNELQTFTSGKFPRTTVLYGGASYRDQIRDLKRGCEIVVGTPGRIQDHLERGTLKLDQIDYFILDEGDEMLDMGFIDDIEHIFEQAKPDARILLFSATMPKPILRIAEQFMGDYEICEEEGFVEEPLLIEQKYWFIRESDKIEALVRIIDMSPNFYGLVFTQTKNDADNVTKMLDEKGYDVAALHGDIPQGQREKILARFRSRKTRVLVATDVAARGIDINGLSHVVNYSLPYDGATYIHRIGRTGRAGTSGTAITFVRPEERRKLEFLKNTVRKAAKGELNEEEVPSVKKVLEVKRERMLDTLKVQLGLMRDPADVKDGVVYIGGGKAQVEGEDLEKQDDFVPELKSVDAIYTKMAAELCAGQDAEAVLAGMLSVTYGKSLDESHYGDITPIRPKGDRFGDRGGRRGERGMGGRRDRFEGEERSDQKRLFIQLGRRDGYNARGIADYFSDLLHIPGKLVDRIDVSTNFSLVSLPIESADKVLELSKIGQIPHVHVDSKSGGRGGRDRDFDDFGGRDRGFGGRRDRGGFGRDRDRGFGRDRDRGFGGRDRDRGFGRKTHAQTERTGASSYKKSSRKEEF